MSIILKGGFIGRPTGALAARWQVEKTVAEIWREFFLNWPTSFSRRGVAIAAFNEQIPFSDFLIGGDILILERPTPDATGGRRVALPFARIDAVKYTDPLRTEQLIEAGFQSARSQPATPKKKTPAPV